MALTISQGLEARLGVDLSQFRRGMARARRISRSAGRTIRRGLRVASRAAAALGAAMAAVGVAAVKMAGDFQEGMTRLNTLVGLSSEQVQQFEQDILALAPAVGKGPKALSEAMFAITSGGARGAEALSILEQAAKASQVGLGDMTEIGRAATAALQAFGDQGLTAEKAIDTMVATVRAGNLEASDLAGSLGRVTGIASSMGVSFEDVNAFIATFSRLGTSAEESVTSLRSILTGLTGANKQAADTFEQLGVPMARVRDVIQKEGLAAGLKLIIDLSQGNIETLTELIPNVRGLAGLLGTAGAQGESFADIQRDINESLGLTNEGFQETRKNLNFLIDRLKATASVALIQIGTELIPVVQRMIDMFVQNLPQIASVFGNTFAFALDSLATFIDGAQTLVDNIAGTPLGRLIGFDDLTQRQELIQLDQTIERVEDLLMLMERGASRDFLGPQFAQLDLPADASRQMVEDFRDDLQRRISNLVEEGAAGGVVSGVTSGLREAAEGLRNISVAVPGMGGGAAPAATEGQSRSFLQALGIPSVGQMVSVLERDFNAALAQTEQMVGFSAFGGARAQFAGGVSNIVGRGGVSGASMGVDVGELGERFRRGTEEASEGLQQSQSQFDRVASVVGGQLVPALSSLLGISVQLPGKILSIASSLLSLVGSFAGGPFGAVGGILGTLGGLFKRGGIVTAQRGLALPPRMRGGIPILAHAGEGVLNRRAVQAIGGPSGVRQLNEQARQGQGGGASVQVGSLSLSFPNVTEQNFARRLPQILKRLADTGELGALARSL